MPPRSLYSPHAASSNSILNGPYTPHPLNKCSTEGSHSRSHTYNPRHSQLPVSFLWPIDRRSHSLSVPISSNLTLGDSRGTPLPHTPDASQGSSISKYTLPALHKKLSELLRCSLRHKDRATPRKHRSNCIGLADGADITFRK